MEFDKNPFEGYPNKWKDPVFQEWLWGYDVESEVAGAWKRYTEGRFPGTGGGFRSRL
jgi:salicylate hydroxylase